MGTLFCNEAPVERGWEWKSPLTLFGLPFLHFSVKIRGNRPVPARGIIAIGQFACGFLAIGQFAVGGIAIGQFTAGVFAAGQFALGYSAFGQLALYLHDGKGLIARSLLHLLTK